MTCTSHPHLQRAWQVAASVVDPEIPALTLAELGILREVRDETIDGVATVVAVLTPTYSGCPAVEFIEDAVATALSDAGFTARIERCLSPAWSSDWISAEGRRKLQASGIAPPGQQSDAPVAFFSTTSPPCPRCGSHHTGQVSAFGSTACKAQYRCLDCREPFDYFKPI